MLRLSGSQAIALAAGLFAGKPLHDQPTHTLHYGTLRDDGRILEANRAFQRILGYSLAELRTMRASDLSPPEDAEVTRGPVRALKAGECDRVEVEKRRTDGSTYKANRSVRVSRKTGDEI